MKAKQDFNRLEKQGKLINIPNNPVISFVGTTLSPLPIGHGIETNDKVSFSYSSGVGGPSFYNQTYGLSSSTPGGLLEFIAVAATQVLNASVQTSLLTTPHDSTALPSGYAVPSNRPANGTLRIYIDSHAGNPVSDSSPTLGLNEFFNDKTLTPYPDNVLAVWDEPAAPGIWTYTPISDLGIVAPAMKSIYTSGVRVALINAPTTPLDRNNWSFIPVNGLDISWPAEALPPDPAAISGPADYYLMLVTAAVIALPSSVLDANGVSQPDFSFPLLTSTISGGTGPLDITDIANVIVNTSIADTIVTSSTNTSISVTNSTTNSASLSTDITGVKQNYILAGNLSVGKQQGTAAIDVQGDISTDGVIKQPNNSKWDSSLGIPQSISQSFTVDGDSDSVSIGDSLFMSPRGTVTSSFAKNNAISVGSAIDLVTHKMFSLPPGNTDTTAQITCKISNSRTFHIHLVNELVAEACTIGVSDWAQPSPIFADNLYSLTIKTEATANKTPLAFAIELGYNKTSDSSLVGVTYVIGTDLHFIAFDVYATSVVVAHTDTIIHSAITVTSPAQLQLHAASLHDFLYGPSIPAASVRSPHLVFYNEADNLINCYYGVDPNEYLVQFIAGTLITDNSIAPADWFSITSASGNEYRFWFDVNSSGLNAPPAPPIGSLITISLLTTDSSIQIANNFVSVLPLHLISISPLGISNPIIRDRYWNNTTPHTSSVTEASFTIAPTIPTPSIGSDYIPTQQVVDSYYGTKLTYKNVIYSTPLLRYSTNNPSCLVVSIMDTPGIGKHTFAYKIEFNFSGTVQHYVEVKDPFISIFNEYYKVFSAGIKELILQAPVLTFVGGVMRADSNSGLDVPQQVKLNAIIIDRTGTKSLFSQLFNMSLVTQGEGPPLSPLNNQIDSESYSLTKLKWIYDSNNPENQNQSNIDSITHLYGPYYLIADLRLLDTRIHKVNIETNTTEFMYVCTSSIFGARESFYHKDSGRVVFIQKNFYTYTHVFPVPIGLANTSASANGVVDTVLQGSITLPNPLSSLGNKFLSQIYPYSLTSETPSSSFKLGTAKTLTEFIAMPEIVPSMQSTSLNKMKMLDDFLPTFTDNFSIFFKSASNKFEMEQIDHDTHLLNSGLNTHLAIDNHIASADPILATVSPHIANTANPHSLSLSSLSDVAPGSPSLKFIIVGDGTSWVSSRIPSRSLIRPITAPIIMTIDDFTVLCDTITLGGAVSVTLPPSPEVGKEVVIKIITGTGPVTVTPNSPSEKIDGVSSVSLTILNESIHLQSDGSTWYKI